MWDKGSLARKAPAAPQGVGWGTQKTSLLLKLWEKCIFRTSSLAASCMYSLSEIRASRSLEGTDGGIKDISAGQQDQGMLAGELAPTPESLWRQGWELPELFLAREPSTGIICCGHKRRSGEGIFSLWKLLRNLHLAASNLFQTGFLSQEREGRAVSLCGPTVNSFLAKNNVLSVKTSQKSRTWVF